MLQFYTLYSVFFAFLLGQSSGYTLDLLQFKSFETKRIQHTVPSKTICCVPRQWEAASYITSGDIFIDSNTFYAYINGSGRMAFDAENLKSYISFNLSQYTPLIPKPQHGRMTVIKDYKKGVKYQISEDGSCDKQKTEKDLSFSCIPDSADKLSTGAVGDGVPVATYQFNQGTDQPVITTATVHNKNGACEPLIVTYMVGTAGNGFLYDIDIVDLTYGIEDPAIFTPPPSCDGV